MFGFCLGFSLLHLIVTRFPEEREHPLTWWDGDFLLPSEMLQLFLLLLDVTLDLESIFHLYSVLVWFDVSSA